MATIASTTRTCSKELSKVLTTPSKIANALDWRRSTGGAVCLMDVHSDRIGITVSQHPSSSSSSMAAASSSSSPASYSLPMRPKGLKKIPDSSRRQLSDIVQKHNVCGFVVSWPIQRDTGLMGASCGRTLFAIEELLSTTPSSSSSSQQPTTNNNDDNNNNSNIGEEKTPQPQPPQKKPQLQQRPVFTPNRPICLWDGVHAEQPKRDAFGRSPVYARTSDKESHRASLEQYHQDEGIAASKVWEDFVRTNWPDLSTTRSQPPAAATPSSSSSRHHPHHGRSLSNFDDDDAWKNSVVRSLVSQTSSSASAPKRRMMAAA